MDGDYEIDEEWIKNFENMENEYDIFYKEKPKIIEIIYIYVDNNKEIEFIKKEDYDLNNEAKILKSNLIFLINDNKIMCEKKYKLLNILKYNFTIEPIEILHELRKLDIADNDNNNDNNNDNKYLQNISAINDVLFNDTIELFSELNTLYLIYADDKNIKQTTKKIFFNNNKNNKNNNNNNNKKMSKTKRKRYKGF